VRLGDDGGQDEVVDRDGAVALGGDQLGGGDEDAAALARVAAARVGRSSTRWDA
jgi:hypothetical protein